MKVYLVTESDWDYHANVAAFYSKDDAEAFIVNMVPKKYQTLYNVEEMEVV